MLIAAKIAFLLLLFLLVFTGIRGILLVTANRKLARIRLHHIREAAFGHRLSDILQRSGFLYRHLSDLLESTGSRVTLPVLFTTSFALLLSGFIGAVLFFPSVKGIVALSLIAALLPYLILRMQLITNQLRTRMDFLPAVEIVYQTYLLAPHPNVRNVIHQALQENRIRYPLKPVFEQLHRNLSMNREVDDALRIFRLSLGHLWADYFASIIRIALMEGNDISLNLKELINDMRKAKLADQIARNRLLEIRIASFSPLFFLAVFLIVNFKINYDNAYHYYFVDAAGRNMLLDALLLIFGGFMMGVYLSMKRM
ncbi:type II secretion system F family protein [Paenibacillus sp. J2TS4]|uniref:type II secretion system F family protein n=1 Tax=Paenibacillus sp. J2TS4 TaxID=2807194 RepID=UPI001B1ACB58|nr:hypothetical protein [Paenibacillus sp. J2TS4]GIP35436.1 hypothetical protein J2TS4_46460 [Paenibacillus sp. J2TS4]